MQRSFSALGRAVWDETARRGRDGCAAAALSVLSVEPYGMKHIQASQKPVERRFLSVLSVEPYGMKHQFRCQQCALQRPFSALGRAVWDETVDRLPSAHARHAFSALGRAVWDETVVGRVYAVPVLAFSALGRAVWDETRRLRGKLISALPFSALGRAVWDETSIPAILGQNQRALSVLSVEPYGMKHCRRLWPVSQHHQLSVLSVEPYGMKPFTLTAAHHSYAPFQCSRSSRMG